MITEDWLLSKGFKEGLSFEKVVRGELFKRGSLTICVAHNDLNKYYVYARQFNDKGEKDDLVLLKNDAQTKHEIQNIYTALSGREL